MYSYTKTYVTDNCHRNGDAIDLFYLFKRSKQCFHFVFHSVYTIFVKR